MNKAAKETLIYRNERKFVITEMSLGRVDAIVKSHPALFSRPYPPRYVNNIYFDVNGYHNYEDNVVGAMDRRKFRIRWYGDQFGRIAKPVMEIKIKKGLAGAKRHIRLAPFELKPGFSITDLKAAWDQSELPSEMKDYFNHLTPTLLNQYRRQYYLSANRKFRVTLDDQLTYTRISRFKNAFMNRVRNYNKVVMELKYDIEHDEEASWITDHFPFRLSKNSKYVNGIDNLDPW